MNLAYACAAKGCGRRNEGGPGGDDVVDHEDASAGEGAAVALGRECGAFEAFAPGAPGLGGAGGAGEETRAGPAEPAGHRSGQEAGLVEAAFAAASSGGGEPGDNVDDFAVDERSH